MEVPPSDLPTEEIKPIVFPDGSIELDHSEITLSSCSFFITINIHHQEGFFYEVYYRDDKYKVLQTKIIESYECSLEKENAISWKIDDVTPGNEYNINCISKAPNGEMKPLCLTYKVTAPCTRPDYSPLLLKSKSRKEIVLKWKAPRTNGKEIDGYTIRMSDGFLSMPQEITLNNTVIEKAKVRECKVPKLKSGLYYAFQIISFNACGETINPVQWFQTAASVPAIPSPPVAVSIGCDSLSLEWRELSQEEFNGSAIQYYTLQMKEGNSGWEVVHSDLKNQAHISKLNYRTSYSFRLSAHNSEGDSPFSSIVEFISFNAVIHQSIGKPHKPTIQPVQIVKRQGKNVVSISWSCDKDDSDLIDKYDIQILQEKKVVVEQECQSSPFAISTLLPGRTYLIAVKCHSVGGWSDYSNSLQITTPSAPPSLTTPPVVNTSIMSPNMKSIKEYNVTASVGWECGDSNGDSIDYYRVEMKLVNPEQAQAAIKSIESLATKEKFMSMEQSNQECEVGAFCHLPDTSGEYWIYSFDYENVRLIRGDSSFKEYVIVPKSMIQLDHPSFTRSKGALTIPEKDQLTSYSPLSITSKWSFIDDVTELSTTISNLLPNMDYCIHILPHNACGMSTGGNDLVFSTPPGPLSQPKPPQVLSTTSSIIELDCTPSSEYDYRGNTTDSIEYYIECDRTHLGEYECVYRGKQPHCTLSSLQSGSIYHIRMAYLSNYGNSPFSPVTTVITRPSPPNPPEKIHLGNLPDVYDPLTFAMIEWSAPQIDNGSEINQYIVELAQVKKEGKMTFHQVGVTNELSFLLQELTPGGRYAIRLQCTNKAGVSNVSPSFTFSTGMLPPDRMDPPMLVRKPTEKAATIRWSEPTSNGSSIVGYRIIIQPIGREYNVKSDVRTQVINKLVGNSEYRVTMVAMNGAGESEVSEELVFMTDSRGIMAPSVTTFKPIHRNDTAVVIEWNEAEDNGASIQKYQLFENNSIVYEGVERKFEFVAEVGKRYVYQVRAVNVIGAGDLSEECVLYIPPPIVEKKTIKQRSTRLPKAIAQGFEIVKNKNVEAILEKNNRKRFGKLRQWWREYRMVLFFVAFVWISIWLFKPVSK